MQSINILKRNKSFKEYHGREQSVVDVIVLRNSVEKHKGNNDTNEEHDHHNIQYEEPKWAKGIPSNAAVGGCPRRGIVEILVVSVTVGFVDTHYPRRRF